MAAAASAGADVSVVTSDNPRGEDPLAIIADIEAAMSGEYRVEPDRAAAIAAALAMAGRDDCVLVAGKGHEDYQLIGARRLPFSDVDCVQRLLEERAA
jgi:UDP-N-acetylmuramoyl-L-alanyl-D-glutamate--2,6-diaminopimelate ligase